MRALEMIHLSTRLVVRHLGLYAGCAFTIAATAVVTGAETTVAAAFGDPGWVFVDGMVREQVTKTAQLAGWLLTAMCGLAIVISGFLVFSAVKQVVSLRQRELAMLRLAGAGRWHVCVMAFLECTTLALVASAPSALLGGALASPFFEMLKTVGMFSRVGLDTSVQVLPIVMVTAVLVLTSATAGLLAARSATRGDLIGSADPLSGRMRPLQVAGRLVVAVACVCAVALIGPDSDAGLAILVPVIAVVPLLALAPFLVPAVTWLAGRVLAPIMSGPAMLAAGRASKDRRRYVGVAMPFILAVGLLGGFHIGNAVDEHRTFGAYGELLTATAVVSVPDAASADRVVDLIGGSASTIARHTSALRPVADPAGNLELKRLNFVDPVAYAELWSQQVVSGDLSQAGGNSIVSGEKGDEVGDTYTLDDAAGNPVTLRVVAVVRDPVNDGLFLDWTQLAAMTGGRAGPPTVFVNGTSDTGELAGKLDENSVAGSVTDVPGYVQRRLDARHVATANSNIGLFGTIYLMSLVGMTQMAIASNLGRRREYSTLRSLGVGRGGVMGVVAVEAVILLVTSAILILGTLLGLGARYALGDASLVGPAIIDVLPQTLGAFGFMSAFLIAGNALGAFLAAGDDPGRA